MINNITTTIKCYECGRFCVPHDSGTFYGGCLDLEPPDPVYFCKNCVDKKIKNEDNGMVMGCWWLKPNYISVVKSILRHRKCYGID
jgi:hypothetical protein